MRISDWSSDVCSSDLPNGVPVPYYYTNPTMIGFTGGGGSTYGGGAEPFIMPVVGDWSPPPAYSQSYYDKSREQASPGSDRKSVVSGKSVSVRVAVGGRRIVKKKTLVLRYKHR